MYRSQHARAGGAGDTGEINRAFGDSFPRQPCKQDGFHVIGINAHGSHALHRPWCQGQRECIHQRAVVHATATDENMFDPHGL